jgi:predicted GNAT family acetyltransferase
MIGPSNEWESGLSESLQPGPPLTRALTAADCPGALARLRCDSRANLLLIDFVRALTESAGDGDGIQIIGAWRAGVLAGMASLRPTLALQGSMDSETLTSLGPSSDRVQSGLVQSAKPLVDAVWPRLQRRGRQALLDRSEIAYSLDVSQPLPFEPTGDVGVRRANQKDLAALVTAARASLREENRPDPFLGDPSGFRRWVRGRISRARVVEHDGEVVFVAYADVRRSDGWLIQGVYTWPQARRAGYASLGLAALAREAAAAGADHVQLAVVDGNDAAIRLYEGLGFRAFSVLRTILFA